MRRLFPETFAENLCRLHSDHAPVLVRCGGLRVERGVQPFRFQAAWVSHPQYDSVVYKAWNRSAHIVSVGLKEVRKDSKEFFDQVFGNIFRRKRKLEKCISDIQKILEAWDSFEPVQTFKELQEAYSLVLH